MNFSLYFLAKKRNAKKMKPRIPQFKPWSYFIWELFEAMPWSCYVKDIGTNWSWHNTRGSLKIRIKLPKILFGVVWPTPTRRAPPAVSSYNKKLLNWLYPYFCILAITDHYCSSNGHTFFKMFWSFYCSITSINIYISLKIKGWI